MTDIFLNFNIDFVFSFFKDFLHTFKIWIHNMILLQIDEFIFQFGFQQWYHAFVAFEAQTLVEFFDAYPLIFIVLGKDVHLFCELGNPR